jgi:hypothetical protein
MTSLRALELYHDHSVCLYVAVLNVLDIETCFLLYLLAEIDTVSLDTPRFNVAAELVTVLRTRDVLGSDPGPGRDGTGYSEMSCDFSQSSANAKLARHIMPQLLLFFILKIIIRL